MKKIYFAAALVLILTAGLLFFIQKKTPENIEKESLQEQGTASVFTPIQKKEAAAISEAAKTASPEQAREELVSFFKKESAGIDTKTENSEEAEERVERQAEAMNASDINYVKQTVLSPKSSANEKIFGVFLLGKAKGKSVSSLGEVAGRAYTVRPNPAPHTVEETAGMQEKAITRMAVDALFDQAREGVEEALVELRRLANEAADPGVRNYITRKLAEFSGR